MHARTTPWALIATSGLQRSCNAVSQPEVKHLAICHSALLSCAACCAWPRATMQTKRVCEQMDFRAVHRSECFHHHPAETVGATAGGHIICQVYTRMCTTVHPQECSVGSQSLCAQQYHRALSIKQSLTRYMVFTA